jgi:hypothetical protein
MVLRPNRAGSATAIHGAGRFGDRLTATVRRRSVLFNMGI